MAAENVVQSALSQIDGLRIRGPQGGCNKWAGEAAKEQLLRFMAAGMSLRDAEKALGVNRITLNNWIRKPGFMEKLRELNEDIYKELDAELAFRAKATHERLYQAADEALDKVIDLMRNADNEVVQLRASQDLMDRRPDTCKVHRIDKRSVNVNIDSKWLEAAAQVEVEERNTING